MKTTTPVTILNVDDNEVARYAISRTLRHAGFTVIEAATGREALQALATSRPALVLLDVYLPDCSGFEICRQIKRDAALMFTVVRLLPADLRYTADSGSHAWK